MQANAVEMQMYWVRRLPGLIRGLGPYALLELTLPGGSVIALAWWIAREHPLTDAWRRRLLAMLVTLIAALTLPVSALAGPGSEIGAQRIALASLDSSTQGICADTTLQQARTTGDLLYQQGDYQHAAECYLRAGEPGLADGAFLKAARPAGADTAHQAAQNTQEAKAQFRKIRDSLHHTR